MALRRLELALVPSLVLRLRKRVLETLLTDWTTTYLFGSFRFD